MSFENIKSIVKSQIVDFVESQNYEEAQKLIDEYLKLFKEQDSEIVSIQSTIYLIKNELQKCIDYLAPLCDQYINTDIYYNLATAYEHIDDLISAVLYYRKSQLISSSPEFRWELTEKIASLIYIDQTEEQLNDYLKYQRELKDYIQFQLQNINQPINPENMIKRSNPFKDLKRSIFIGTMEIANHISQYTMTFRAMSLHVFSLDYHPNYLNYSNDLVLNVQLLDSNTQSVFYYLNAIDIISEFDYFHFVFNMALMPDRRDLVLLKALNKRTFMHNLGSEIRIPSLARKHHPYWKVAEKDYLSHLNEPGIIQNLKFVSSYIDNVIVNDYEMLSYVKDYYKNVYMIGLPISLDKYPYTPSLNKKLLIVHAPTNPAVKGSYYFLKAVEELQSEFDFDFIKVQGYSHDEAKKIYRRADIILDELVIGTYGSLTMESLSMGKCVVTYISDAFPTPHESKIPVQIATIDNVKEKIRELILSDDLRQSLSINGRKYVETYCDVKKICKNLLDIYTGDTLPIQK